MWLGFLVGRSSDWAYYISWPAERAAPAAHPSAAARAIKPFANGASSLAGNVAAGRAAVASSTF